jgi:thymidylate kinase
MFFFVCGGCRNRDEFRPYFTKVFNLKIDDNTMRRRLAGRTNNEFGKKPEEVELMLTLNREDDRPANSIDIDAARPLKDVVDDILAQCRIWRQL